MSSPRLQESTHQQVVRALQRAFERAQQSHHEAEAEAIKQELDRQTRRTA